MSHASSNGTLPRSFLHLLREIVGADGLLTEAADCWPYGYDNSRRHEPPLAVALPANHEQVAAIVRLCRDYQIALTPRGRGTATTGAAVPPHGGIALSLERMTRILRIVPEDRLMVVEAGVTNEQVQKTAAQYGFFWPPDPTSSAVCTVGGNLACNAAGPRAVKYGTARDNVLGLRAVTGSGDELRTGVFTTKGVVGYDLTRLLIGSEGTLAVITEATLRLTPLAEKTATLRALYRDTGSAARAVARIMAQPFTPCALELMDHGAIEMIRRYSQAELPTQAGALLMIELDGSEAALGDAVRAVVAAAEGAGCIEVRSATGPNEVAKLWETRKALSPALRTVAPKKINEDVAVPVSRLPELLDGLTELAARHGITIINFGHAGNGNIHVNLLVDPEDPVQMGHAHACLSEVFDLVLRLDGTLSGEHGIGLEKREFVARELDAIALALMARIKRQFDPEGILNPGKKFPLS